jgi:DNA polymerase
MKLPASIDTLRELELLSALPRDWLDAVVTPAPAVASAPRANVAPAVASSRAPLLQPPPAAAQTVTAAVALPVADPIRVARIATLDWDALVTDMATCQACRLCEKRQQAVPGVGARDAPWLFVGEGPGADEDEQGEPFVGQAGKLLDAMLAATGLQRGREVYIANVVKCRPPGNRTPSPDEAQACAPYLDRQIALIQPKIIVALGKTAVTRLTGRDTSMASLRQQRFEYQGLPVVATYHPAYLLRNLPDKLKAWEDLVFARRVLAGNL